MSVFLFIIIIVALVTCGEAWTKSIEGRSNRSVQAGADPAEVERLREQVERLSDEVARLTEEQRFMTRLLEGSTDRTDAV